MQRPVIHAVARRLGVVAVALTALACAAPATAAPLELLPTAPVTSGFCGQSVAAGDVNDDGRDDVVVGCRRDTAGGVPNAGSALVFVRNSANTGFESPVQLTHPQPAQLDACGTSVATGDVNADGRDDVVMSCDGDAITGASNTGSAVVLRRNASNTGFETGVVLTATGQADNDICQDVAVGDLTGDGRADIAIGCDASGDLNEGIAYVHVSAANGGFGNFPVPPPTPTDSFDRCGADVAIGDVTGDGRRDLVVGCSGRGARGTAAVYPNTGSGGSVTFGAGTDIDPGAGAGPCGGAVATGDVNGDGSADVAIGCYQVTPPGTSAFSGAVAVHLRSGSGFGAATWLYPPIPVSSAACGTSVKIAEVGGDARPDVVMGCPGDTVGGKTTAGSAVAFLRATTNDGFGAGTALGLAAPAAQDRCAESVAIGDIDANGGGDILMGCRQRNVGAVSDAGIAAVFPGDPPSPLPPVVPVAPAAPPAPTPPPAPAPPAAASSDRSPTSVTASVVTVTAVPVNADGSYTSPTVTCGESGRCVIVMDSRTVPSATRSALGAAAKSISVAKARFTLAGGKRGSVKMRLNARGKALLRKRRTLKITTTVTVTDASKNSRRFTARTTLKKGKLR